MMKLIEDAFDLFIVSCVVGLIAFVIGIITYVVLAGC